MSRNTLQDQYTWSKHVFFCWCCFFKKSLFSLFYVLILCEKVEGNGAFLPLSSLRMYAEQKWAAVKHCYWVNVEVKVWQLGGISSSLGMSTSKWAPLLWCLSHPADGKEPIKAVLIGHELSSIGVPSLSCNFWGCLMSTLEKAPTMCHAEVRRTEMHCGAGGFIYRSSLPVFYPCLSLSLFAKAWLVD